MRPTARLRHRHRLLAGVAAAGLTAALAIAPAARAQSSAALDADPPSAVHIAAGPLYAALMSLAAQTHQQLLFTPALVAGLRAPAVDGRLTIDQALAQLLSQTDIEARRAAPGVLVLRDRRASAQPAAARGGSPQASDPPRPFGAEAPGATPTFGVAADPTANPAAGPPTEVRAVEVTGSHIRGAGPGASPLVTLTRADLARSGRATLAEALSALPQNFGGEASETATATGADRSGVNPGYGTGVNLRGLGADATLVLLDGRRLSGAGTRADFADISTIPAIAVDRVELLLDGASALYGSDAVGGVVNIILRHDFDGAEVRAEAGSGTRHGPQEAQVGAVLGHRWASGSLLVSYEAYRRTALDAADRPFTASADLRPLGGSDWRSTFSHPGNILRRDPVTGATAPYWGVPPGQPGVGLTAADLRAGALNLENPRADTDILPDQRRQGGYLALRQDLGARVTLSTDLLYGFRAARTRMAAPTALLPVTPANPFYVPLPGLAFEQIQYAFSGDLPPPQVRATAEAVQGSIGAEARLAGDWRLSGYLGVSQQRETTRTAGIVNSAALYEALGLDPDDPATAYSPGRDGYFNPYTGAAANPPAVMAAIGSGFSTSASRSRVTTANLQADGTLLRLPGGDLRIALGAQARREAFVTDGVNQTATATPQTLAQVSVARTVRAVFAELRAPLVGPDNRRPGIEALELSAAGRWERYSDFGATANPKLGVLYRPVADLTLRATFGRSYRAPGLREIHDRPLYSPGLFPLGATRVLGLILNGGNPELKPETADAWTLGGDWRPTPHLRLSLTGFDIRYRHRIDRPVIANLVGALSDPALAAFVRRLSAGDPTDLADITALLASPYTSTAQGVFPPASYGAIVDARYVNTGRLAVRGLDLSGAYDQALAGGRLTLAASATRLLRYDQALTPTAPTLQRAGIVGHPAKLRARLTADWSRGPWTLGAALNHTSAFHSAVGTRVGADDTVDLQAAWSPETGSALAGTRLTLNVRNLFDTAPPFYDNPAGLGFDPANADLVGRFVSLQLSRRW